MLAIQRKSFAMAEATKHNLDLATEKLHAISLNLESDSAQHEKCTRHLRPGWKWSLDSLEQKGLLNLAEKSQ